MRKYSRKTHVSLRAIVLLLFVWCLQFASETIYYLLVIIDNIYCGVYFKECTILKVYTL